MSTLREIREALTSVLQDVSAPVVRVLPARFTPPIAVLVPGSPYVESGDTFASSRVRHTVVLIVGSSNSSTASDRLDELIGQTLEAVVASPGFCLDSIDQPALYTHSGNEFLSCAVNIMVHEQVVG